MKYPEDVLYLPVKDTTNAITGWAILWASADEPVPNQDYYWWLSREGQWVRVKFNVHLETLRPKVNLVYKTVEQAKEHWQECCKIYNKFAGLPKEILKVVHKMQVFTEVISMEVTKRRTRRWEARMEIKYSLDKGQLRKLTECEYFCKVCFTDGYGEVSSRLAVLFESRKVREEREREEKERLKREKALCARR